MKILLPVRDGLELRTLEVSEAQNFFEVIRENETHLRRWLPWLDEDKTVTDLEKYLTDSNKRLADKEGIDFGIFFDGKYIGGIGLFPWDHKNKSTSIGYWLTEDSQGKGVMTDCLKVVIAYCFEEMKLHRITIGCAVDNIQSSALPKKLGFSFEGVARQSEWLYDHFVDIELYSLLISEWKK